MFAKKDSDNLFILNLFVTATSFSFMFIHNPELRPNDFFWLLVLIIPFLVTKFSNCKKQSPVVFIISCVCKIFIIICFLYAAFCLISRVMNNEVEKKVDYEIAFPIDSDNKDWLFSSKGDNSQIFDVVILHSGTQVILMKGKLEKGELILYYAGYSFQDADKYMYVRQIFSKTSPSELPYELLN